MKRLLLILLIIGFMAPMTSAQKKAFNMDVDYAHFRANDYENFLEIYYALYPNEWTYVQQADGDSVAEVVMELSLFNADSLIDRKMWRLEQKKKDVRENIARLDLIRYRLIPGKYRAVLKAEDVNNPAAADSAEFEIKNDAFPRSQLTLSDLQLCRTVRNATSNSVPVLVKNQLEVVPNPGRMFGSPYPVMFFYVEVYNLLEGIKGQHYTVNYFVTDYDGKEVKYVRQYSRTKKIPGNTAVEIGMVNLSKLPSGTYWLYFAVSDSSREHLAYTRSRFYCYNPEADVELAKEKPKGITTINTYSIYERMAPVQINNELQYITYIATRQEKKIIKSLKDLDAKKRFLVQFWEKRDPDPDKPGNKYRDTYLERVRFANQKFSGLEEGWKTDFGRVYILYGPPTNVERYPSTMTGRAYQIWSYENLQGGVQFIFIDMRGYQQYELVHSTLRGEVENYNWRQLLELNYQRPPGREY